MNSPEDVVGEAFALLVCDAAFALCTGAIAEELVVVDAVDTLVDAWNAVARLLISEGVRGAPVLAAVELLLLLELVWGLAGELLLVRPVTLVERRFCSDVCNGLVEHEPEAPVGFGPTLDAEDVDCCCAALLLAPGDAGDGVTVDNCNWISIM